VTGAADAAADPIEASGQQFLFQIKREVVDEIGLGAFEQGHYRGRYGLVGATGEIHIHYGNGSLWLQQSSWLPQDQPAGWLRHLMQQQKCRHKIKGSAGQAGGFW